MSRLYDRIMRGKCYLAEYENLINWFLEDAQVISADNVATYCTDKQLGREAWKDYPSYAPPFQTMFIEAKMPSGQNIPEKAGLIVFAVEGEDRQRKLFEQYCDAAHIPQEMILRQPFFDDEAKWFLWCTLICDWGKYGTRLEYMVLLRAREDGSLIRGNFPGVYMQCGLIYGHAKIIQTALEETHEYDDMEIGRAVGQSTVYVLLNIPFMALSLMHCKNVELIEETPPPALSKSHEKKYGVPMVKYKVLKVNSMHREYANDDRESQPGIPKSLHICRGHFKDYRNGGLFGKLEGIYWWDSHVRGSAKRGVTIKDYDVQAPRP